MSTMALAVSTETSSWSAFTASPGLTCHSTISASCRPSPRSGSLKYFIAALLVSGVVQGGLAGGEDVLDARQVELLQAVKRRRDIRRGDPLDRRLQVEQGPLVEAGGDLRADPAGLRRLVHYHAAPGLAHRGLQGV